MSTGVLGPHAEAGSALDLYGAALDAAAGGRAADLTVHGAGGSAVLRLDGWTGKLTDADRSVIDHCQGPTLDVGCGPGRFTVGVAATGTACLGVDISATAVRLTRRRGGRAVRRSVFGRVPGAGRWRHLLLTDGNVGIGGEPRALLSRCRSLLDPAGTVLVELEPPGSPSGAGTVWLHHAGRTSQPFRWAYLSVDDLAESAAAAAFRVADRWCVAGRWFAALAPRCDEGRGPDQGEPLRR